MQNGNLRPSHSDLVAGNHVELRSCGVRKELDEIATTVNSSGADPEAVQFLQSVQLGDLALPNCITELENNGF